MPGVTTDVGRYPCELYVSMLASPGCSLCDGGSGGEGWSEYGPGWGRRCSSRSCSHPLECVCGGGEAYCGGGEIIFLGGES